ncbi:hypothetical protein DFH06DRAFT_1332398 [Mycena polygramma]|nr:hypothetical protein DFH06DRAFT_1332398 [Mycena polygramma]
MSGERPHPIDDEDPQDESAGRAGGGGIGESRRASLGENKYAPSPFSESHADSTRSRYPAFGAPSPPSHHAQALRPHPAPIIRPHGMKNGTWTTPEADNLYACSRSSRSPCRLITPASLDVRAASPTGSGRRSVDRESVGDWKRLGVARGCGPAESFTPFSPARACPFWDRFYCVKLRATLACSVRVGKRQGSVLEAPRQVYDRDLAVYKKRCSVARAFVPILPVGLSDAHERQCSRRFDECRG